MAQEEDFYATIVRDPRFAREIGNVVVEFGDAAQQAIIDQYTSGQDVPYDTLRKVWSNTEGWFPTVLEIGYLDFFAQVREVNSKLPLSQQIHIWLGDPPIQWAKIKTSNDLSRLPDRDRYAADVIESKILAAHSKALVIYGIGHFSGSGSMRSLVDLYAPSSSYVIDPYFGFQQQRCSSRFEKMGEDGFAPEILSPVKGSSLETLLRMPGCTFVDASQFSFDAGVTAAQRAASIAAINAKVSGLNADALLYLGPAASLTESTSSSDIFLDSAFSKEVNRRAIIRTGHALEGFGVKNNPVSPRYLHPYGAASSGR